LTPGGRDVREGPDARDGPDRSGAAEPSDTRFVVLEHRDAAGLHYDLMIESGGRGLATWKLGQPPEEAATNELGCKRLVDHRKVYLEYEGPISGDRGQVSRRDAGRCVIHASRPNDWEVVFEGKRLQGRFRLVESEEAEGFWAFRSCGS